MCSRPFTMVWVPDAVTMLLMLLVVRGSAFYVAPLVSRSVVNHPKVCGSSRNSPLTLSFSSSPDDTEWTSDFDEFVGDGGGEAYQDEDDFASMFQSAASPLDDLTACQTRQFSLGQDLVLSDFVGNMGFDEVTDWEYYYPSEDDPDERKVVQPNPFDQSQPKRTRTSSGSVVRLFRGEFVGQLGGILSSQGRDRRVLVKEFSGEVALQLVKAEQVSVGKLQSALLAESGGEGFKSGEWVKTAASRSVQARKDNENVAKLVGTLSNEAMFVGILGEVNLAELDGDLEPNEFYRALGVPPPKPGSVWVVYEYAGLSSLQLYSQPAEKRRAAMPPKKGFFGNIVDPPPIPAFKDRANYVVKGIMKQAIEAVALIHENGLVHRSIGRSSLIVSSTAMDKREAASPYATLIPQLTMKLTDFGFSGLCSESTLSEDFRTRARSFGLAFREGETSVEATNFAIAEDMHALGFVFLGLLLTSLADVASADSIVPATDEDTLQRLLGEIFEKDMDQFREYVEAEEVWSGVVALLDGNGGAGWTVLETLLLAREKAASTSGEQLFTIRGLLSNSFFTA